MTNLKVLNTRKVRASEHHQNVFKANKNADFPETRHVRHFCGRWRRIFGIFGRLFVLLKNTIKCRIFSFFKYCTEFQPRIANRQNPPANFSQPAKRGQATRHPREAAPRDQGPASQPTHINAYQVAIFVNIVGSFTIWERLYD